MGVAATLPELSEWTFTTEFVPKALKQLFFVLIVFITAENTSCVYIKVGDKSLT